MVIMYAHRYYTRVIIVIYFDGEYPVIGYTVVQLITLIGENRVSVVTWCARGFTLRIIVSATVSR